MAETKLPFRQRFVAILSEKLLDLLTATTRNETAISETVASLELAVEGSPRFRPDLWPSQFFVDERLVFENRASGPDLIHWALEIHDFLDDERDRGLAR